MGRLKFHVLFWASLLALVVAASHAVAASEASGRQRLGFLGFNGSYDGVVGPAVLVARVDGVIDKGVEDYLDSAIARAEEANMPLVIILNTPGGFLESAMNIVWSIDKSRVPVIGFVEDGWAMSAGTLILVSTHVAAMAPGTQIGSMQPVAYNPATGSYEPVNESKLINAILEFLDQHAASKGRNETALRMFVTENLNLGPDEAVRYHVVEFVADDLGDLISKVNGSIVATRAGKYKLILNGSVVEYRPGLRATLLHALSDPMVSSLLLSLGTLILLFTLASGHAAFATIGVLLLLLGLAGSGFNPNIAAIALLVIGGILVLIEINTPGFGVIGGTGIVMLILGAALTPVSPKGFAVTPSYANRFLYIIYALGGLMGGFTALVVYKVIQVRKRKPEIWTIKGARGRAIDPIGPGKPGFVVVEGEYWKALSDEPVKPGDEVVVVGKDGAVLKVKPASGSRPSGKE